MINWVEIEKEQKEVCRKYELDWRPLAKDLMIAVNNSLFTDVQPINGLRHPSQGTIDGWYLWSGGEIPDDDNFFVPLHPEHLLIKKPVVLKFLGLPAGWRFQIDDNGYEDVWFEESLLNID